MSGIRSIVRGPTHKGYASRESAPIFIDSADDRLKFLPAGGGTTAYTVTDSRDGGAGSILTASLSLTNAQIKTFEDDTAVNPAVIVAAVANTVYMVHGVAVMIDTRLGAYTNCLAADLYLAWGDVASGVVSGLHLDLQSVLTGTGRAVTMHPWMEAALAQFTLYGESSMIGVNKPLGIYFTGIGGGPFTGGNAANSMAVTVYYSTLTVPA
jgi:hypothetical protein